MANPNLPAWLASTLGPAGVVLGAFAKTLIEKWRHRRSDRAQAGVHEASAADTLVGTALRLVEQLQLELESLRERLNFCQEERRLQEDVLTRLRDLVDCLTEERDNLRELLDKETRPH